MRRLINIVILLFASCRAVAQTEVDIAPILEFLGVEELESVDENEVERLMEYLSSPLSINVAGEMRLRESGLMSQYQIASLRDYIVNHGPVLSFLELSSLDGFSKDFVGRLAPFVSLKSPSGNCIDLDDSRKVRNEVSLRSFAKPSLSEESYSVLSYGGRYRINSGNFFEAAFSFLKGYQSEGVLPDTYAGGFRLNSQKYALKLIAGDFNARFGQGLALWNGMSMSALSSPSSFAKRPSGLSLSSSFTGSSALTGMGMEIQFGKLILNMMAAVPGLKSVNKSAMSLLPAANVVWLTSNGQYGVTHYLEFANLFSPLMTRIPDMKTSFDMTCCFRGIDVFAEAAYDWVNGTLASVGGTVIPIGESLRMAFMLRYYPQYYNPSRSGAARSTTRCSNEHAMTLGMESSVGQYIRLNGSGGQSASVRRHVAGFSLDASFFPVAKASGFRHSAQLKLQSSWQYTLSSSLQLKLRITERIRSWGLPFRTDFRTDLKWFSSIFNATFRINLLRSDGLGIMSYAECGAKGRNTAAYLRAGVFHVDDWDDRIYVYERDGPGCFNVPALYGRGFWISLSSSLKTMRFGRIYFRASLTSYPFMETEKRKPGKAELKLQYVLRF